ncbi:MAG: general secretion pathway protein GspE [Archangium sp.]|nr:general secretion pathway protein GspE [Archangium sp.]
MALKRIGELLLERGSITQAQLEAGLAAQKRTRQRLGITLIQQGVISEVQLAIVLAQSLGFGSVDLPKVQIDWSAVHMLRARFCENHEVFPFGIEGKGTPEKKLLVAMSDPLNQNAIEEIEFTTGLKPSIRVATYSHVREAILRYYHKVPPAEAAASARGVATQQRPPAASPAPTEVPSTEVVIGEEIISAMNAVGDPSLEKLITDRQNQAQAKKKLPTGVAKDLDFLFGGAGDEVESVEKLERKFWVLMRIMARKGLISREEFMRELDGDE